MTEKIIEALCGFVIRVSQGQATSETEINILPEIAKLLLGCKNTLDFTSTSSEDDVNKRCCL